MTPFISIPNITQMGFLQKESIKFSKNTVQTSKNPWTALSVYPTPALQIYETPSRKQVYTIYLNKKELHNSYSLFYNENIKNKK